MSRIVALFALLAVALVICQTETGVQAESTPLCPVNETWMPCGNLCEKECNTKFKPCPRICVPSGACGCAASYFRNQDDNKCVLSQDCP
ncbi:unnamed protein product [Xylocopa violacea]|uniref:TIL domain-containing protein n=1 Tax=Xylocopa violacea TaxID=135666 RepID=A0ABP1P4Z4_XYLVO